MLIDEGDFDPVTQALARIAGPEVMYHCQLANDPRDALNDDGWHRLLCAVLLRALVDYWRMTGSRREVLRWITSPANGPFSFTGICRAFGWNSDAFRIKTLTWCIRVDWGWRPPVKHRSPAGGTRSRRPKPRRVRA